MQRSSLLNTTVGEYRIVEFLGAGGMGEVYRAVHNKIGRVAAVKVLTQAAHEEGLLERFFNEARIQSGLHHPNVATLYDFIEFEGQACIIMEYVDGQTLAERVRPSGPLPLAETVYIFQAVVEAVAYLHNHGIVHRDIKSNNIKISSDGQVKLLDFGIAKAEASPGLTATGSVIGTLEYLSPEQLMGGRADARSDIWALGVLLYEMVTGRVPFEALTLGELCKKIERVEYAPPAVLNPSVPREITAAISRCLRKNPTDRYRLAQDLLAETKRLRQLVSTPGLSTINVAPRSSSSHRAALPHIHWKTASIAAGAALGLLLVFGGVYFGAGGFGGATPTPAGEVTTTPDQPLDSPAETAAAMTTTTGGAETRSLTIDAVGGRAEVYRDGTKVGETPCPLNVRLGDTVSLTLRREGFAPQNEKFTVTAQTKTKTFLMQRSEPSAEGSTDATKQ